MRHIGLFGGTFNPVHSGHLLAAQAVLEALNLDEIRFIPAAHSPLKQRPDLADRHRVEMLRLALDARADFVLDQRELARPGRSNRLASAIVGRVSEFGELGDCGMPRALESTCRRDR